MSTEATTREQLIRSIAASGRRQEHSIPASLDRGRFLELYYEQAAEDALTHAPHELAAAALNHLELAASRRPGHAKVRAFNPTNERDGYTSQYTIVETVNDDMPFLVDSLTMALNKLCHPVHRTIHPVLQVSRGPDGRLEDVGGEHADCAESWIHFEIPRETYPPVLERIEARLRRTLDSVRAAVEDWGAMLAHMRDSAEQLRTPDGVDTELVRECYEFLRWLADDHFTLLGYREYELERGTHTDELVARPGTGLGILREEQRELDSMTLRGRTREEARSAFPLIVTKANSKSTIHRPVLLDYIGVKVLDDEGRPAAERRFLGLLTSVAYSESPRDIPLLRLKVREVMERSGLDPRSHRGKALQHILDTFPRDDLIQASVEELSRIALGVLALGEHHKVSLFLRRETFRRFYSCLVYLPREQYNSDARRRIEALLTERLHGELVDAQPTITESTLARLVVLVRTDPARPAQVDVEALRREIEEAVRTWNDRLRERLLTTRKEEEALSLFHDYAGAFSQAYKEAHAAERADRDLGHLRALEADNAQLRMALEPVPGAARERMRFTTFVPDEPILLYRAMPILQNLGVNLVATDNYHIETGGLSIWIQDFDVDAPAAQALDAAALEPRFSECFASVLLGRAENDDFNNFVVTAGLDWRETALLRAYCKYILQTGILFSQSYMREVLGRYPALCRALVDEFFACFDPDLSAGDRDRLAHESRSTLHAELDRVASLDDDRILTAFTSSVDATLRTNFFQREQGDPKQHIALKLDPKKIIELPQPRPQFEIFVYAQRVEGVHLRGGRIARGGIRWSDRREDFRSEILGLMKAQQVKNTVIVPDGAKGGFVCKVLPEGDRDAVAAEVVACYRTFISGLLDITDNIVGGEPVTPERVLCRDEPDPYLVVAADKGTASFSDVANEIAGSYGFWLGDAFASGGSAGYDHKQMAITARGAWEAVKRHFRELGVDTQKEPFTVAGIGDMSGDVFGNGMLLSDRIRLVAAFNHEHIFIDPDPDPVASFEERRRLFGLRRSSWQDYDTARLSEGGGIYSRRAKSIELHAAARAALGIERASLTPPELVRAILCAPVDLLFNGGIGTYVKARAEANIEAGDPVNDGVRVDGADLRCRVVAEGGNLGLTQRGRIEFALAGGRINTDFIDNSGGVDSSDREVNIKILLDDAIEARLLRRNRRNGLLAEMTDDVAGLVLASNYAQTQALSVLHARAAERAGEHARLIRLLESSGLLDRRIEHLPGDEELEQRRALGQSLTRPELAVVMSYSKIQLTSSLSASGIGSDPYFGKELVAYFPPQLRELFSSLIPRHRLAREIVAMLVSSSMINRLGPYFPLRAREETSASLPDVARAYMVVRDVFSAQALWRQVEALDLRIHPRVQYDAMFEIARMMRRAVYWVLRHKRDVHDVDACAASLRPGISALLDALPGVLAGRARERFDALVREHEALGLPSSVARGIASLNGIALYLDIVEIAAARRHDVDSVARLYFELGQRLKLDWLREQIEQVRVEGRWHALARATLRDNLAEEQAALVHDVLDAAAGGDPRAALAGWLGEAAEQVDRTQRTLADMQTVSQLDFAALSVALTEVGRLRPSGAG